MKFLPTLPGMVYGHLTVIEPGPYIKIFKKKTWKCRCSCGSIRIVRQDMLRSGNTSSCGCLQKEKSSRFIAGLSLKHGKHGTSEYNTWREMKARCYRQSVPNFKDYGGRGIRVCDRWKNSFEAFLADMGPRPSSAHSIDRINNDGNYEPGNCRWTISKTQQRNKRSNRLIAVGGISLTLAEWGDRTGLKPSTIWARLHRGLSPNSAVGRGLRKRS